MALYSRLDRKYNIFLGFKDTTHGRYITLKFISQSVITNQEPITLLQTKNAWIEIAFKLSPAR